VHHGIFVRLGDHLQFEYPSRYRVPYPSTWSPYGPHLYVPTGIFNVSPAGHLVAPESATTGNFICDECLPRPVRSVGPQAACITLGCKRSLANTRAVIDVPDLLRFER
jgi:hypothetical protein